MLRALIGALLLAMFCVQPLPPQQAPAAPAPAQVAPSPKALLEAMAKTYAECRTYQDTGTVVTRFLEKNGAHKSEIEFRTAFVRPDRFRFEFTGSFPPSQYIVWSKEGNVRTWWSIQGGEKPASLDLALAGATGVSMGAAHHVPALLLPAEVSGWVLTQLADPTSLEDAPLGTRTCHRVKGVLVDNPTTLWLDASTNLVLRIDSQAQFPSFRTETTTTYEPVLDGDVPEALLAFGATTR